MAASNADTGFGVDLLLETSAGSGVYASFGVEITSISPPNISRTAIDVTHSASPNEFREFTAGIMDGGEVSMEINYIPSISDAVYTALLAGKQSFRVQTSTNIAWTFDAIVTGHSPATPLDDKMTASVTFKVSGKPVLTDES